MSGPPDYRDYPGNHNDLGHSYNTGGHWSSLSNNHNDLGFEPLSNRFYNNPNPYQHQESQQYERREPPNQMISTQSVAHRHMEEEEAPVSVRSSTQNHPPATRQSVRHAPYPSTAPPQVPAMATTTRTRRPNRTPAEIQADEAALALKRQEKANKAAGKAAEMRLKATQKAAWDIIKAKEKANAATRLKWTLESSLELLKYIRMVKEEHAIEDQQHPGFIRFTKFFETYAERKDAFPLIEEIDNDARMRRFQALMNSYRQVRDWVDRSGSDGLFAAMVRFVLPQPLYDILSEMNKKNRAANAAGQDEMEDTYEALMKQPDDCEPDWDDGSDREDNIGADVSGSSTPASPLVAAPRRRRQRSLELTDAERALDEDTPPPSHHEESDCPQPTPDRAATEVAAKTTVGSTPTTGSTPSSTVNPKTTAKTPGSRPPAEGGSLPRRRGKTQEAPKKDDSTGQALLLFMHKSQEQSTKWMMEERTRAENTRAEDRRAAEARADLKEKTRQDQLNEAKLDREAALLEARLAREADIRQEELREEARARDRTEDNRRYEASQERMATSQAAMMIALAKMAGSSGPSPSS